MSKPREPAKRMTSAELRSAFLEFFRGQGHAVVPSSSLVPGNDPTLLFTNAGMVQFKDVFLGKDKRPYTRAASSQRCVRAGGKHNDLENVGYTSRHHTFFEMLGNFSFGDYFKREAIEYAWNFVTGTLGIPGERLWVTVYEEDDGAAEIWLKHIGVDPGRFTRLGAKSNFWAMGDTGPCGPCTEIFYDHGPGIAGGPPGSPDEDGDRYVEIWNLVFMQYDRAADGTLTPLPKPSVDTGMGLERVAAVMQGVHGNYEIDLFANLIHAAAEATGALDLKSNSLRVIADHIRATSFLIADGVLPSNEGRGYVLRRIMRRAIRHGFMLGQKEPFFHRLVAPLECEMGAAYPELGAKRDLIERAILQEEERFAETLAQGMGLLDTAIASLPGKVIAGDTVFKLYDTYGFPLDLTADIARERGLEIDTAGFEAAMDAQRARARAASRFGVDLRAKVEVDAHSEFTGYEQPAGQGRVLALLRGTESVDAARRGRGGAGRARPHALLRRERRPGRRPRLAARSRWQGVRGARHAEARQGARPRRDAAHRHARGRRCARGAHRRVAAPGDAPQSHGDAPVARGPAQRAWQACHAEGFAGRAGAAALRLLASHAGHRRGTARDRAARECADPR